MEKILRTCIGHEAAEEFDRQDALLQSVTERFNAFMTIMAPHYASAGRLQRIYRVDDFPERKVCDDWGVRLPIPVKSAELLLANKLASGRPKDLTDAAELKKIDGLS